MAMARCKECDNEISSTAKSCPYCKTECPLGSLTDTVKLKRIKRDLNLIANFVNGYAEGWYFAIGECFRDALDIKYTERIEPFCIDGIRQYETIEKNGVIKKKLLTNKVMKWTQGPYISFAEGDSIYDTPEAYLPWGMAIKHIKLMCKVIRSIPNNCDTDGRFVTGHITFTLSKPNENRDGLEKIGQYELTQNQFVDYLRSGVLPIKNGNKIQLSLFETKFPGFLAE